MAEMGLFDQVYNPDVLSCLANLSNDEVFTPPEVANAMLDMLPQELFRNPDTKFLDPACKSGVFLREIAKRLIVGLERQYPDLQDRIDHIFHNQLYGISITELTSLLSRRSVYCSKYPNSEFSVTQFDNAQGNIRFKRIQHTWENGKCKYCGTSQIGDLSEEKRGDDLETHAYEFIHTLRPEEIFNMRFDVVISNPPYQLSDSGHGMSAKPIYQLFVNMGKKLKPRYMTMIIPARWYAGGKGLDEFRASMLNDRHILQLVDYENSDEVFTGVDIAGGICYFLWDRDNEGDCSITNYYDGKPVISTRPLNEYDTFIRHARAISIIHKATEFSRRNHLPSLENKISARKPFGLPTNYQPKESGVPCWFIQRIGLKYAKPSDVNDPNKYRDKWKLLIPPAPIAGQTDFSKPVGFYYDGNTRIAKPGEICTESWLVACAFNTKEEVESFRSYLFTKVFRFLLLQTVVSQHVTKKNFCFVPDFMKYDRIFTDDILRKELGITDEEWAFIDSKISSVEGA
ncbi:MAG: Eco57I restriction-modification methylase domain-containing protein [Lachnospiraceae bacterium]|nr:Eco57I restriction-modification methylase domain-containing protein [Lachnospiraceae bacterium]